MLFDFGTTVVADASGERLKIALAEGGEVRAHLECRNMAMEGFAQALSDLCGGDPNKVGAFALCVGPGSMLSTRVASCVVATIAALSGAKLFEWDTMQVAAFAVSSGFVPDSPACGRLRILAPSRRGFVNYLDFDGGKIAVQTEAEIDSLEPLPDAPAFLLDQRAAVDPRLADFPRLDLSASAAVRTLAAYPLLARQTDGAPEPKSLVKREYVKWKAQAHI